MKRAMKNALVLAALVLAPPLARAADLDLALMPGSKLWLNGTSNVHEYSSKASRLDVVFRHEGAAWNEALPRGEAIEKLVRERGVTSIEVTVPVKGLHSGKDGLDKNMYKALLADKHAEIRFTMKSYDVRDGAGSGVIAIDARGKLTVAGVEKEQPIAATAVREGDAVRLRGRVALKMTQFGIKPPTMLMGALRTSDDVTVQFDLLIGASEPPLAGTEPKGASH